MASESENYIRRSMELAKVAAKIFPFKKIIQGEKHIRNPDPDSYWKILPDGCYVRKYFKMLNSLPCTYEDYYTTTLITIQLDCVRNHLLLSKSNTFVKCIKHRSKSHILQHQIDPDLNLHPYQQLLPLGPEYQTS